MEKILGGMKTEIIWSDSVGVDANTIMPIGTGNLNNPNKASTVSIMDLGKMLLVCAKDGETSKVHELMSRGAPFTTDWLGTSPLHMAAMNNHLETCEVLLRAGISKDARTKVDRTPLHFAVYEGHSLIVELLLKNKCDVNAKDMLKMSPLHWAVEKRHSKLVSLLLRHGADVTAMSKFDKTPITLAIETKQNDVFQELISHNDMTICQAEQQEATNSLMYEMEKDNYEPLNQTDLESDMVYNTSDSLTTASYPATAKSQTANSQKIQNNTTKSLDSPALQILKDHGISMLPIEDTDNSIINSALQSGRKLILSDAGKQLILNYPKSFKSEASNVNALITDQMIATQNGAFKRKASAVLMPNIPAKNASLKTNKVIKILTAEEFNKMCGGKVSNTTFKKISTESLNNGALRLDSVHPSTLVNLSKTNKKTIMNKCKISPVPNLAKNSFSNEIKLAPIQPVALKSVNNLQRIPKLCSPMIVNSSNTNSNHDLTSVNSSQKRLVYNLDPPHLVISTPSPTTNNIPPTLAASELMSTAATTTISAQKQSQPQNLITIPKTSLNDIMRQLFDLKKQTDDLRKQMDLYQKQNEEYRIRLEKLEKEKDGTKHYTNSNS